VTSSRTPAIEELVAAQRVFVGLVTTDAVLLGHVLGRHAHVVVVEDVPQAVVDHGVDELGLGHAHAIAVACLGQHERGLVHVLDATRHNHV